MSGICVLDSDSCLTLESILNAFHCGIKEEQSWAVVYQTITSLKRFISNKNNKPVINGLTISQIFIQSDGCVHQKCWRSKCEEKEVSIKAMIASIGVSVYQALDFGNSNDEEIVITSSLEHLFELMTDEEINDKADEGIEDCDCGQQLMDQILDTCEKHVYDNRNVCDHYRNVCRALVAEAIEMSTFLNQISIGTKELQKINNQTNNKEMEEMQVQVWAHLWMKVMHQLRVGVTLKSIDRQEFADQQKREYELTPFEILLDDINSKRYTLKKVMIPKKVETDARDLIMQFIRSRPPLKPVKDRQLKPLPAFEPSLHDKLMAGIKQSPTLRPTPPLRRKFDSLYVPKGKRYSNIFPLNSGQNLESVETNFAKKSPFRRLSFRNLSLRNNSYNQNRVVVAQPTQPTPSYRRQSFSFWAKLCHTLW